MNKIVIRLAAILCLLALSLGIISCGDSDEAESTEYHEAGLHFTLDESFRRLTVSWSQYCYYAEAGRAYFYFDLLTAERLEENDYPADISVKNYTLKFCLVNDIALDKYDYDEAADRTVIRYTTDYPSSNGGDVETDHHWHVIFRASGLMYVVTMICPEEHLATYGEMFESLAAEIHAE